MIKEKNIQSVTIIGAGNVAYHLAHAFYTHGIIINEIYNRSREAGLTLANEVDATYISDIIELSNQSDIYIIAVKDDSIKSVVERFPFKDKILVHTSGSVPMDVFKERQLNYGVFYPLQTFTKNNQVNFDRVNLCIEGNSTSNEALLINLGRILSKSVTVISSSDRLKLHLAAVFACNFSNFMQVIASDIVDENQYELLKPLIEETFNKLKKASPSVIQTGPAIRDDKKVLAKHHIVLVQEYPEYSYLYNTITDLIKNKFHDKD